MTGAQEPTWEIVLGPPGTGKTHTLIERVRAELAAGTPPDRVGYVSFTRRAADEAVQRAGGALGLTKRDLPYFRTLHSMCFLRLGMTRKDVFEGAQLQEFADFARIRVTGKFSEDGTFAGYAPGDRALHMINLARVRRVPLERMHHLDDDQLSWPEVLRVDKALRQYKSDMALLDYTDMLEEFVRAGLPGNLDVLIVDEAQDLSTLQWAVVEQLAKGCRSVVVAGDDDQAIYPWAGADVEHLISMPGAVRVLGQSYRVPRAVQAVAERLIAQVHHRRPKEWAARDDEGLITPADGLDGIRTQVEGDVLVLARNTYFLREQVAPWLRRAGVVYEMHEHSSLSGPLLEAIIAWERLRAGGTALADEVRGIYKWMSVNTGYKRGMKELPGMEPERQLTIGDLVKECGLRTQELWSVAMDKIPASDMAYIMAVRRRGEKLRARPRVRLSTIHGAKGGQAEHVVVLTDMAPRTHTEMERVSAEDEARVWYVAVTRARQQLTVVRPQTRLYCPWL